MYVVFSQFVWPELSVPDLFLQFLTCRKLYISDWDKLRVGSCTSIDCFKDSWVFEGLWVKMRCFAHRRSITVAIIHMMIVMETAACFRNWRDPSPCSWTKDERAGRVGKGSSANQEFSISSHQRDSSETYSLRALFWLYWSWSFFSSFLRAQVISYSSWLFISEFSSHFLNHLNIYVNKWMTQISYIIYNLFWKPKTYCLWTSFSIMFLQIIFNGSIEFCRMDASW